MADEGLCISPRVCDDAKQSVESVVTDGVGHNVCMHTSVETKLMNFVQICCLRTTNLSTPPWARRHIYVIYTYALGLIYSCNRIATL